MLCSAVLCARMRFDIGQTTPPDGCPILPQCSTNDSMDDGGSGGGSSTTAGSASTTAGGGSKPQSMGRKNDFIVWLRLKPMQRKLYEVSTGGRVVVTLFLPRFEASICCS